MKYVLWSFHKPDLSIYSVLLSYPCAKSVKVSTQFANGVVCHGGLKAWVGNMKTKWPGRFLRPTGRVPDWGIRVALVLERSSRLANVLAGSSWSGYLHIAFSFVTCSVEVLQGNNALILACCFQTNETQGGRVAR